MRSEAKTRLESILDPAYVLTVAKGASIQFFGIMFGVLMKYGFMVVAARTLGAHHYGRFVLALSIVQPVSLVSLFGLDRGVVRYLAGLRARANTPAERGVVLSATVIVGISGLTLGALTVLLGERIGGLFPDNTRGLADVLRTMAWAILGVSLYSVLGSVTAGQKRMGHNVLVMRIIQPLSAVLFLTVLPSFLPTRGATLAYVLSTFTAALFGIYFVREYFWPGSGRATYHLKPNLLLSLPVLGAAMLQRTTNQLEI